MDENNDYKLRKRRKEKNRKGKEDIKRKSP